MPDKIVQLDITTLTSIGELKKVFVTKIKEKNIDGAEDITEE